jgi:TonB family protein
MKNLGLIAFAIAGGALLWPSGVSAQLPCLPGVGCVWPGDIPREDQKLLDQLSIIQQQGQQPLPSLSPPGTVVPEAPTAPQSAALAPPLSLNYRGALRVWLEGHQHYPEGAQQRGERGKVQLHFRVARSGHVLDYEVIGSSGYPDLDAAVEAMIRGATLPPFPADMTAPEIGVTTTLIFEPSATAPDVPPSAQPSAPQQAALAGAPISEQSRAPIGPGFDCAKATQPLAWLICSSPELSKTDLLFNQAYQALRHQLDPVGQRQLAQDDLEFLDSVRRFCGVPEAGAVAGSSDCVGAQYNRKRSEWITRLNGPAREEATRPIERHVALQADLQRLGFVPATAKIDGVYNAATRAAILAWQNATGRPVTGFIGDADAVTLGRAAAQQSPGGTPSASQPSAQAAEWDQIVKKQAAEMRSKQITGDEIRQQQRAADGIRQQRAADEQRAAEQRDADERRDTVSAIFLLLIIFFVYFLPTIVAAARHHHNATPIFLLNLFLGWTFVGWVAALVWSATAVTRPVP